MKYILILLALLLTGCTLHSPLVSEYRISPEIQEQTLNSSSCKSKSIKIAHVFSPSSLMSKKMNYTQDEHKEFTYNESEWSQSPARSITAELLTSIRDTKIFKNVSNFKSRSRSQLILETNVEDFIQHYKDENRESFAKVTLSFSLVDTKTSNTLDSITISKEVEVDTLDAEGGVVALNHALSLVLQENNTWLNGVCK